MDTAVDGWTGGAAAWASGAGPGWPAVLAVLALLGAAGMLTGFVLRRRLLAGGYRGPLEWRRPVPDPRWLPPALGVAFPLLGAALAVRAAPPYPPLGYALAPYLLAAAWLAALAAIDQDVHRLPDGLTVPAHPAVFVALAVASVAVADTAALGRAALGGVAAAGVYGGLYAVGRAVGRLRARNARRAPGSSGLGLGDVKLSGPLGMLLGWLGWGPWAVGIYAGFVVGGIAAITLLLTGRARRDTRLAHGPAMALGALAGVLSSVVPG